VSNTWLDENVRSKGFLGETYPYYLFIMEGDTPSFLGLLNNGLASYRNPGWEAGEDATFFVSPSESHGPSGLREATASQGSRIPETLSPAWTATATPLTRRRSGAGVKHSNTTSLPEWTGL